MSSIVPNDNESVHFEKENNNENDERCAACFNNNLILKKILSTLPTSALLRSTLVNKVWNHEARLILKNSRKVIVNIGPGNPCQDLNRLLLAMANMAVVPYNGLRVTIDLTTHTSVTAAKCQSVSIEPSELIQLSLNGFKYLEVNWKTWRRKVVDCEAVSVLSALLNSNRLTELYLRVPEDAPVAPLPCLAQGQVQLENLKVLKLPRQGVSQGHLNSIKTIVLKATNLAQVWHDGTPPFVHMLLGVNKAHLIKVFEFQSAREVLNRNIALCGPQLCELKVQAEDFVDLDVLSSFRTLNFILESSRSSLKYLKIDAIFLYGIIRAKIVLQNVTKLDVLIECPAIDVGRPVVYSVLQRLNFTKTFPILSHIDFRAGSVGATASVIQMLRAEEKKYEGSSSKVKHVSFHGCLRPHTARYFAGIFPTITSLFASFSGMAEVPFGQIWAGWPLLEEIVLSVKETSAYVWHRRAVNLDVALCGISTEEVAELRKIGCQELERVHIVPVRPSILNLKGLRKLGISLRGSGSEPGATYSRDCCLSKVGAMLGIRRLPGLRVIIATDGQDLTQGVINSEGQEWVEQRRFTLRHLRDFGFGKNTGEELITNELKEFIQGLEKNVGQTISMNRSFGVAVLNTLWMILSGVRYEQDDPRLWSILKQNEELGVRLSKAPLVFIFPKLAFRFPKLTGFDSIQEVLLQFRTVAMEHVNKHKEAIKFDDQPRDFIDAYLNEIKATTDSSSSFYGSAGMRSLIAVVSDMFTAGADTTSNTLSWIVLYMAKFPHVQAKLHAELDEVVGKSRSPILADRPKMPYTEAVITEAMRMSSIAPVGVFHRAMKDVKFHGYDIPKGSFVVANIHYIHHSPKLWNNPEQFQPERFLSSDGKSFKKHDAWIPFSVGKRVCLGETLARDTLFLYFTNIYHKFSIQLAEESKDATLDPAPGFLLAPQDFKVLLTERQ